METPEERVAHARFLINESWEREERAFRCDPDAARDQWEKKAAEEQEKGRGTMIDLWDLGKRGLL